MKRSKKLVFVLLLFALLFSFKHIRADSTKEKASNGYRVHNLTTGFNYTTIQETIDNSTTRNGDVIFAEKGTYNEHVTISKSISLIGEERDTTIVDANGTGTTILMTTGNISVINFTIRNAGKAWSGVGYPDSCIKGNSVANVCIENNTLTDAAVCAWFYSSSSVNITSNIVFNATSAGIIGYSSSHIRVCSNFVHNCGLMGIHLDSGSINCTIANNTVIDTLEGIELENYSTENRIEENNLINNNVSFVLNRCGNLNVFRNNNMTNNQYNLVVFGTQIGSFMQDIDNSNTVNNKAVYYLTDLHNVIINSSDYTNLGYLAIANCTNVTMRDFDITRNKDGLLMAYSTNCTLTNITISENRGPLMYGGLTFYKSSNNKIVNNRISNNSYTICFYQSNDNMFYHNLFNHNSIQVVADFFSPFGGSTTTSVNFWDNNLEGNYWSDYTGLDENKDGIGDSSYPVVALPTIPPELKQYDHYPLMGIFHSFHAFSDYYVDIISNSTIEDFSYSHSNNTIRIVVSNITANQTFGFCRICISHALMTEPYNVTIDGAQPYYVNYTIYDNGTHRWIYFSYQHSTHEIIITPEFPLMMLIPIMVASFSTTLICKRKRIHFKSL